MVHRTYTTPAAAKACGLPIQCLRNLIKSGKLPAFHLTNGAYYIAENDLIEELLTDYSVLDGRREKNVKEDEELRKIAREHGVPYMVSLPDAAKMTGIPAGHYRKLVIDGKIRYYCSGDRYYLSLDVIREELTGTHKPPKQYASGK